MASEPQLVELVLAVNSRWVTVLPGAAIRIKFKEDGSENEEGIDSAHLTKLHDALQDACFSEEAEAEAKGEQT